MGWFELLREVLLKQRGEKCKSNLAKAFLRTQEKGFQDSQLVSLKKLLLEVIDLFTIDRLFRARRHREHLQCAGRLFMQDIYTDC